MKILRLYACLFILLLSTEVFAQSDITMKYNWMFTDVAISNSGITHKVPGMIDTGASVCIIDSTFAVDSCHIKNIKGDKSIGNTSGKSIKSSDFYLDSIAFGGIVYTRVWCYIVDLSGKLKQYAPKFIIGGDVLKKDLWCFDLKKYKLQRLANIPDTVETTFRWKKYFDAGLNEIYFKGKIGGHKTRILFDTGSRRNELISSSKVTPTSFIKSPSTNIAETLSYKEVGLCKDVPVQLSDFSFKVDFIKPKEPGADYPRINTDFLQGKKWVLEYKQRLLVILNNN